MGWKIDPNHEKFKLYRLKMAADKVRKGTFLRSIMSMQTKNLIRKVSISEK